MICPHHYHNHNQFEFVVISSVSLGLKKESEEIDALASRTRRSEQKTSPASQSNVYHDLLQTGHCLPLLVSVCAFDRRMKYRALPILTFSPPPPLIPVIWFYTRL